VPRTSFTVPPTLTPWAFIAPCREQSPVNDGACNRSKGTPPDLFDPPKGCSYFARCPYAMRLCEDNDPSRFYTESGSLFALLASSPVRPPQRP
jgi:ABC-type dipeptide/oligopeptide/nickel transport system ATPase component